MLINILPGCGTLTKPAEHPNTTYYIDFGDLLTVMSAEAHGEA
jgi:hypothetical protein